MIVKEISKKTFDEFVKNYAQNNYFQTTNYSILMKNYKYEVMFIGAYNENEIVGASLILYKSIAPMIKYGYAPRGFLLNYFDFDLLNEFTEKTKSFFAHKNFAFIKINPEIIYSKIDINNKRKEVIPKSKELITYMRSINYEKLRNNLYFESMLPKYNAIVNLKEFNKESVTNKCLVKSFSVINKSLKLKLGTSKDIKTFYNLVKNKATKKRNYYEDMYELYKKDNMIDLLLMEIDYYKYLDIYKEKYEEVIRENEEINKKFNLNPYDNDCYIEKNKSDKKVSEIEHKINIVNNKLKNNITKEIIGSALVIKQDNKASIVLSGIDQNFKNLNYKYFLYYTMLNYYKKLNFSYFDLNGISGNFTEKNPYKGLNDFKLSFNPEVYEYIGEFDLVINNTYYNILWNTEKLKKEFMH